MVTKKDTIKVLEFKVTDDMLNQHNLLHGGELFKMMDTVAGYISEEFGGKRSLTKAVNNFTFVSPTYNGETVRVKGIMDYAGRTSMEIFMRATIPKRDNIEVAHGYFTMVAVDDNLKSMEIQNLKLETLEDEKYYNQALERRKIYKEIDKLKEKF